MVTSDNPKYPKTKLQPRDRDSADLKAQVARIENNLMPERVMESTNANMGAPLMLPDGNILNGNGRTMGIRGAYQQGKAESYRQAILDNAQRLGLNAEEVSKMKNPVLVRTPTSDLTDEQINAFTQSKSGGANFSATEQAKVDAGKLTSDMLTGYSVNQDGNIDLSAPANREFVNNIFGAVTNANESPAYRQKDGTLNKKGIDRVKSTLFSKAYGDDEKLLEMSNSPDDNVRNVTNALLNAAPKMAQVQLGMEQGTLNKYEKMSKDISEAAQKLSALKNQNISVGEYLNQQSMFDADREEMRNILEFMDKNKRSGRKLTKFLNEIAEDIKRQGDPRQGELFSEKKKPLSEMEIINRAKKKVEENGN